MMSGVTSRKWRFWLIVGMISSIILTMGFSWLRMNSAPKEAVIAAVKEPTNPLTQTPTATIGGESDKPVSLYNSNGQLQQIVYPDGSSYKCSYNANGEKIMEQDNNGTKWIYLYDKNLIRVIDSKGNVKEQAMAAAK